MRRRSARLSAMTAWMAAHRADSLTGLIRKSDTPIFIADTTSAGLGCVAMTTADTVFAAARAVVGELRPRRERNQVQPEARGRLLDRPPGLWMPPSSHAPERDTPGDAAFAIPPGGSARTGIAFASCWSSNARHVGRARRTGDAHALSTAVFFRSYRTSRERIQPSS